MNTFSIILSVGDDLSSAIGVYRSVIHQRSPEDQLIILASTLEFTNSTFGIGPNDIIVDVKHRRLSQSKNVARRLALGDCAIFLDENQTLSDNYLSSVRPIPLQSSIYTNFSKKTSSGKPAAVDLTEFDINQIFVSNLLPSGCFLYTRQDYKKFAFDEDLEILEDWDFQLNVLSNSGFEFMPGKGSVQTKTPAALLVRN